MKTNQLYRGTFCIDIDCVIADFEEQFCVDFDFYQNRHVYNLYERCRDSGIPDQKISNYLISPQVYKGLPVILGGWMLAAQARRRGYYVMLITARSYDNLQSATMEWLNKHDVVFDEVSFTKDKAEYIADYNELFRNRRVRFLVDDSISILSEVDTKNPELGVYTAAWSQLWNLDYPRRLRWNSELNQIEIYDRHTYPQWRWIWDS